MNYPEKTLWIGLDVGKKTFVAAVDLLSESGEKQSLKSLPVREFKRSEMGSGSFLKWLEENFPDYCFAVVMEATGCYSLELRKWLHGNRPELPVTIYNCRQIKDFIGSLNLHHKTDHQDARAIARFGTERMPAPTPAGNKTRERLKELGREREALIRARTALQNRRDALFDPFTRKINGRAMAALTMQITAIEKEIEKQIKQDKEFSAQAKLLVTTPGVSMISAYALLAELGPLDQYSARELSAISGLAPRIYSSGSSLNKSHLSKRGSARVRQVLYMDSLTAVNKIPELEALYQRITAQGKSKMTARCACMRKLLLIMRAMIVENREYCQNFSKNFQNTI